MVYCLEKEESYRAKALFNDWQETLIWSALQGCMGEVYVNDKLNPCSGQIVIGDFCFFAGEPENELVMNIPDSFKSSIIIMAGQNEEWDRLIEKIYEKRAERRSRYAIKKEKDIFDQTKLREITKRLDKKYKLKMIDEELYNHIVEEDWSRDLCSQFENYEDYSMRGIGAAVVHNGRVVSGASSYTVYNEGIEIEIDTKPEYRRKGLALACGAMLILECLSKGLYPSWDAQNKASLELSKKLGYHFDKEYTVYEVET